jgi:hypothetical protein
VYAVINEFDLRIHQSPSGRDVRRLGETLADTAPAVPS